MQDESNPSGTPPVIFICYARKDNQDSDFKRCWLDRLRGHLKPLERQKKSIVWCDQRIDLGNEWDPDIHNALHSAKVAIALMSPAFFASDYICEKEIPAILQQVDEGKTTLLPILLSPFEPGAAEFEYGDPQTGKKVRSLMQLQAANGMNRSLLGLPEHEQDAVLAKVAQRAREIVSGKKSEGSGSAELGKGTLNNLPRSTPETFVGRAETLEEIDDRLAEGQIVTTVVELSETTCLTSEQSSSKEVISSQNQIIISQISTRHEICISKLKDLDEIGQSGHVESEIIKELKKETIARHIELLYKHLQPDNS